MTKYLPLAAIAAITLGAAQANAQASSQQRNPIEAILGTLFPDRSGATNSLEGQWAAGRTPLANQQLQFRNRVNADVRSGVLSPAAGDRLISEYAALVRLELKYGADGFTAFERNQLAGRYRELTRILETGDSGGLPDENDADPISVVADGQAEFNGRVADALRARRIGPVQAARLRNDYAALVRLEAGYLSDGVISDAEEQTLDSRLQALDLRVGDSGAIVLTPRQRLDAIASALPASGLSTVAQNQLRVEHGDLLRLDAAYARLTVTAEERAYLERRLADLELRARVRR